MELKAKREKETAMQTKTKHKRIAQRRSGNTAKGINRKARLGRTAGKNCYTIQPIGALNKQDLFINSTMAQFGLNILWKMFREAKIKHRGCYVNLDSLTVNSIPVREI